MTLRLQVDLDKIQHNARRLVEMLGPRGISVTGVTKASLGCPAIAEAMLRGGVSGLGDSRIENLEAMRRAGVSAPMTLLRSPMLCQAARVVACADLSFNTELEVLRALSLAARAAGRTHGVILMVELGDLREGILPADLEHAVRQTLRLPGIAFQGLGANLACRSGVSPDDGNMAQLSALADSTESVFGPIVRTVSGGNSANLLWALGSTRIGRIDELRLGESILLGRETLHRKAIESLHTDAFTLFAEVIEAKRKPSRPWGDIAEAAFGPVPASVDHGPIAQAILALGRQDVDPTGLIPPAGIEILGASSDHLILDAGRTHLAVGAEVAFQLNYSALLRAMTSPFVAKVLSVPQSPVLAVAAG